MVYYIQVVNRHPGVAQFGSALEWGSRGRRFDSCHSDHRNKGHLVRGVPFSLYFVRGIGVEQAVPRKFSAEFPKVKRLLWSVFKPLR